MLQQLIDRSGNACELCLSTKELTPFLLDERNSTICDNYVQVCSKCKAQIEDPESLEPNHWRCLNESMWSEVQAVKVISWRMLNRLKSFGWPQELLEIMYMDEDTLAWAKANGEGRDEDEQILHKDSNGAVLIQGDTVTLIKDLDVKGGGFTAKRGTAVRNIRLVHDNPEQIEGKVEGQSIIILTRFVKK
jgi:protein PhnA